MTLTIRPDPGGQITEPGLYRMAEDRYHADPCETPSASSSLLKLLTQPPERLSMLHAWAAHPRMNPDRRERRTDAMDFGRAAHMAAFEPERFRDSYAIKPDGMSFATKDGKAWRADVEARGLEILSFADAEAITGMADALFAHRQAKALLSGAESEVSAFWRDAETGVWCRARFDRLPTQAGRLIPDYKTTADLFEIERDAQKYQWHVQAAMYLDAYRAVTGEPAKGFVMVAQEKAAPYAVVTAPWDPTWIEQGRMLYRTALARFAACLSRGTGREHWPGPPVRTLIQPHWAQRAFEARAESGEFSEAASAADEQEKAA